MNADRDRNSHGSDSDGASSLGLRASRLYGSALGLAVPPAGLAWFCGAGAIGTAAVGVAAAASSAWLVRSLVRRLTRDVVGPMRAVSAMAEGLRKGDSTDRIQIDGVPLVCELGQMLARAARAVEERSRVSQANLMSVEAAFDRIHSVLQSLAEGVILIDPVGSVVLANNCSRRVLVDDGQPVEGRNIVELLEGDLRGHIESALKSIRGEGRDSVQIQGLSYQDRVYDVMVVQAQSTRFGVGFGTVIALVDVTRNHEIGRLKDQFLSTMSHELRTPLTNICAFTEILEQLSPDNEKDWREFVNIVISESHRLTALIDDILESSKLHNGEIELSFGEVDMAEQARLAIDLFREQAAEKKIEIDCEVLDGDVMGYGDSKRLHEVLTRILDNALKFTPEGGRVRVRVEAVPDAVDVSVADSGPGVALEDREEVFERFRQIGDHMTDKPSGTGLGLPMCRGFVDSMGGSIWCDESDLGGAELRFVIPSAVAVT